MCVGELLLYRVQPILGVANPLDGDDMHALDRVEGGKAGIDGAMDENVIGANMGDHDCARTAATFATSELGTGETIFCVIGLVC